MLVIYHSFAIYNGAWKPIDGFPTINAYTWVADISYICLLEMFVFISGLILGFQVLNKTSAFLTNLLFIKKKAFRLLIPSIVFSTIYVLIFTNSFTLSSISDILQGVGHMWFLPMLFWCFCLIAIISKFNISGKWLLMFVFVISILPLPHFPFQISRSIYYFSFFYLGFLIGNKTIVLDKIINYKTVISLLVLYILGVLMYHFIKYEVQPKDVFLSKFIYLFSKKICFSLTSMCLLLSIYLYIQIWMSNRVLTLPIYLVKFSGMCFGVYLVHQFILKLLYNNTDYVQFCGALYLPILSCIITLTTSILIVYLMCKTKIGRFLLT